MVGQQMTRAEAISLAALAVWAGGLVHLTSRFAERTFVAVAGAHPTDGELLATAVVVVGGLSMIRELVVLPSAAPPSALLQRPILVVAAVVVTAVLMMTEGGHIAQLDEWMVVSPMLFATGIAFVQRPTVDRLRVVRGARGRP